MSLRGGFGKAGSDNGDSTVSYPIRGNSNSSLLNTPLGNTMKKLGMTPNMGGNNLNRFLVKRGDGSSNSNTFTH